MNSQLFVGAAQRLSRLGAWELSRMLQALLRLGALNGPEAQPWIAAFLDALTARVSAVLGHLTHVPTPRSARICLISRVCVFTCVVCRCAIQCSVLYAS
jgi:hypothetical protein